MSDAFFRDLQIPEPDINLKVGARTGPLQISEIMSGLAPIFSDDRPDLVLVVGDVNSTLAAALVAVKLAIPIAHVEAGLRSFDRTMPEEINRILTDAVADYCFTTEPAANENLAREGIGAARIHYVGNVMIDALFGSRDRTATSSIVQRLGLALRNFAVLTLHRPSNVDAPDSFGRLLDAIANISREIPVIFPAHPRTRERLHALVDGGRPIGGIRVVEPLPYIDFIALMGSSLCVLTDSGGIQEETTALGVPCLTLRTTTERPITVTQGTNRIVGLDADRIAAAWGSLRRGDWPKGHLPELWDGGTSRRIIATLTR
jgi:UDP-N-acetylglucosamine 2-epimerase (non-hydrolysing)